MWSESPARELQVSVQAFVRTFGLLVTKQTPCGQAVSPSYAHALMLLLEREALEVRTTQTDLAEQLGLDKSSITRLCARLEADGRVAQEPAAEDARSRVLGLTARGRKLATTIQAASLERFQRVIDAVPISKRRALLESIETLTRAVERLAEGAS